MSTEYHCKTHTSQNICLQFQIEQSWPVIFEENRGSIEFIQKKPNPNIQIICYLRCHGYLKKKNGLLIHVHVPLVRLIIFLTTFLPGKIILHYMSWVLYERLKLFKCQLFCVLSNIILSVNFFVFVKRQSRLHLCTIPTHGVNKLSSEEDHRFFSRM